MCPPDCKCLICIYLGSLSCQAPAKWQENTSLVGLRNSMVFITRALRDFLSVFNSCQIAVNMLAWLPMLNPSNREKINKICYLIVNQKMQGGLVRWALSWLLTSVQYLVPVSPWIANLAVIMLVIQFSDNRACDRMLRSQAQRIVNICSRQCL